MDHEYDQHRKHSPAAGTTHNDTVEPGQSSRSALLRKPEQPIASGLVQRKVGSAQAASAQRSLEISVRPDHVEAAYEHPVQQAYGTGGDATAVHAAAARGVATTSSPLPHADTIQRAFGRHDVSGVQAHVGDDAAASAREMGAAAYAAGNHVVLGKGTDLHTVAHEAAHVVQQRGGVQLQGGVGEVGDQYEQHADAVADAVVQGRSAEALLDALAPSPRGDDGAGPIQMQGAGGSSSNAGKVVQRSIGCHPIVGGDQFQIDAVRPAWAPHAAAIALAPNQARCHVIAFEVIQNDLANILNVMLANRGTPAFNAAPLNALCTSLFVTAGAPAVAMNANRVALIAALTVLPAGVALTAVQRANLTALSGALLSDLNSCPDNLRAGNAALNGSIGYSVDADFLPGSTWYHGPIVAAGAMPAVGVPPPGAAVMGPGAAAPGAVGPFEAVRLSPAHEPKVYAYQGAATLALSFVVNGGGGAVFPGVAPGTQLSSTQLPTAVGHPVIVIGGGNPLVFA